MAETIRTLPEIMRAAADPSLLRDALASIDGCYGQMDTAAQPITKDITTSFVALTAFTHAGPAKDVAINLTNGTFTLVGGAGRYLVWANVTVLDANQSDLVFLAVHKNGVVEPALHVEATMTATIEVLMSIQGIIECPAGTEVLTLRVKATTGTTASGWIGQWGIKRL